MSGFYLMVVENPGPCTLMLASPFLGLAAVLLRLHAERRIARGDLP